MCYIKQANSNLSKIAKIYMLLPGSFHMYLI